MSEPMSMDVWKLLLLTAKMHSLAVPVLQIQA